MDLLQILLGVALLYAGGEGLVRGAAALGRRFGLTPMVIGLTVVSFGTSSPELAASLTAVLQGSPAVSYGNIVGSNIANLGLVLGATAAIWPLAVAARFLNREMPLLTVVSALMFWLVRDGSIDRLEGLGLVVALAIYLRFLLRQPAEPEAVTEEFEREYGGGSRSVAWSLVLVLGGIGLLVLGANSLVHGAVGIARDLGVSERVIGLTVVAFGTSLPELAACVVAAMKREGDIVLGNLIGSNLFNILLILGTTALVRPLSLETQSVQLDLAVMLALTRVVWL
ncbi:MAG: calcium/sodium antiporter, partial [Thermoanaerobaculia bacterium]